MILKQNYERNRFRTMERQKPGGTVQVEIINTRASAKDTSSLRRGMRAGSNAALALALVIAISCIAGPACADKTSKSQKNLRPTLEEQILRYTNDERRKKELPALHSSEALRFAARKHSSDMCRTETFRHESKSFPKGWETFPERLKKVGLRAGGENIAYRTLTRNSDEWARKVVRGWMNSPEHRKNILNPKFRYLGVGVTDCKKLGYATQVFSPDKGKTP